MKSAHTLAYSQNHDRGSRLKLPRALASFPARTPVCALAPIAPAQLPTRQKLPLLWPWKISTLGKWRLLQPGTVSEWGEGDLDWCSWRWWIRSCLELWWVCQDHHSMHPSLYWALTPALLASALLTSGAKVTLLWVGRAHTQKEWNQLTHELQGFCSSTLGTAHAPGHDRMVMTTEQRRRSDIPLLWL